LNAVSAIRKRGSLWHAEPPAWQSIDTRFLTLAYSTRARTSPQFRRCNLRDLLKVAEWNASPQKSSNPTRGEMADLPLSRHFFPRSTLLKQTTPPPLSSANLERMFDCTAWYWLIDRWSAPLRFFCCVARIEQIRGVEDGRDFFLTREKKNSSRLLSHFCFSFFSFLFSAPTGINQATESDGRFSHLFLSLHFFFRSSREKESTCKRSQASLLRTRLLHKMADNTSNSKPGAASSSAAPMPPLKKRPLSNAAPAPRPVVRPRADEVRDHVLFLPSTLRRSD
jgi:hypothetical protein